MIRISQLRVKPGSDMEHIKEKAAGILGVGKGALLDLQILKRSMDARNKGNITEVLTVILSLEDEDKVLSKCKSASVSRYEKISYTYPSHGTSPRDSRPVIAGYGPAGIFLAHALAHEGYRPLVYERGKRMEERVSDTERFFLSGVLDTGSNVQFGEGGAGTFSDGKLHTGIKDHEGRIEHILKTFTEHGAPADILTDNAPHIGTDLLRHIIPSIRKETEAMGGEICFGRCVTDIFTDEDGRICGVELDHAERVECTDLFLCIGHSARDTFGMLHERQIPMEAKAFAVGVRAEHDREMIDKALHGDKASYKLTCHCRDGRGVYTFCMCPGGYVVNASSEEGGLAVNGMSYSGRSGDHSNAAIVCTVGPEDFASYGDDVLSGMRMQQDLERRAFSECQGRIPYQRLGDLEADRVSDAKLMEPMCKGAWGAGNIRNILPGYMVDDIIEGMHHFAGKIPGYDGENVLLSAVESRTSSPVRILREKESMESVGIPGLYPVGEGAGYAGGIISAAVDGLKAAEKYIGRYR